MKNIINKLLLGVFTIGLVSSLSAQQTIRLVAKKTKTTFVELNHKRADNPEAWDSFWSARKRNFKTGATVYSETIEIAEGEALRPVQLQYLNVAALDTWPETGNFHALYSEKAALEFKLPEIDQWLELHHEPGADTWSGVNSKKPLIYGPAKVRLALIPATNMQSGHYSVRPGDPIDDGATFYQNSRAGYAWCLLEFTRTWGFLEANNNITVLPNSASDLNLIIEASDDMVNWTRELSGKKPAGNRKRFYRLRAIKE